MVLATVTPHLMLWKEHMHAHTHTTIQNDRRNPAVLLTGENEDEKLNEVMHEAWRFNRDCKPLRDGLHGLSWDGKGVWVGACGCGWVYPKSHCVSCSCNYTHWMWVLVTLNCPHKTLIHIVSQLLHNLTIVNDSKTCWSLEQGICVFHTLFY